MGNAERIQSESPMAAQASAAYRSRGVPADWFVDPADPEAAEQYGAASRSSLEDAATAFLAAHAAEASVPVNEAFESVTEISARASEDAEEHGIAAVTLLERPAEITPEPLWLGLPLTGEPEEGELGWQSDALCAQTDPEAFFPEKGGSTRDAKKVCGACTVRAECLEYALSNDERFGIWGGLSERERRRLRKRAV